MREWISIKKELPREDVRIILCAPGHDGRAFSGMLSDGLWLDLEPGPFGRDITLPIRAGTVTHWMPFPALPGRKDDQYGRRQNALGRSAT